MLCPYCEVCRMVLYPSTIAELIGDILFWADNSYWHCPYCGYEEAAAYTLRRAK